MSRVVPRNPLWHTRFYDVDVVGYHFIWYIHLQLATHYTAAMFAFENPLADFTGNNFKCIWFDTKRIV